VIRPVAIGHQQAVRLVELFRRFPVQDLTSGMMMAALDARQRFQLSYRDAAIIGASPRAMGCTLLPLALRTVAALAEIALGQRKSCSYGRGRGDRSAR